MKTTINTLSYLWLLVATSAYGEVVTDGTVGAHQSLSGQMTIPQSLGTTVSNNLFHSFSTFNINTGESATFTGANTLQNVISRVTGGQVSNIDGLLRSTIGNANFYFINPAGVTFGANAVVNVPAAFHVSTANQINFADGNIYSATNPSASTLTIADPASFGFLNSAPASIQINGSQLSIKNGQSLDLVAGSITIKDNAKLIAPEGEIRLVATQGQSDVSLIRDSANNLPLPPPRS